MIDSNQLIKYEVPSYAELICRRDIPDKTLVLVKDSLNDPENKNKIKRGLYVFFFDCQEWYRVCDIPEDTLDEEFQDIIKEYFKPGKEHELITALIHFKDKIYERAPEASVDYKPWIEELTDKWLWHADAVAKEQKGDPMDLNAGFRMQICIIFFMILKSSNNNTDFTQELMFHLACQLTK